MFALFSSRVSYILVSYEEGVNLNEEGELIVIQKPGAMLKENILKSNK